MPALTVAAADPAGDAAALGRLAEWAGRYTPWAATDGADGLMLDITGCAHLYGDGSGEKGGGGQDGEAALVADAAARLNRAGIAVRTAAADTPAAAWAWARFRPSGPPGPILPAGAAAHPFLLALPVAALRLPAGLAADLGRVGLRTIGDLARLPRAPLAARYGAVVLQRLDRMLGAAPEPIAPRPPPLRWLSRLAFAEPIAQREAIEAATRRLVEDLCTQLERAGRGARRLDLALFRVDAVVQRLGAGASLPSHDPAHLFRLFRERFDTVEPGFGIDAMVLKATATEAVTAVQAGFGARPDVTALAQLVDRLRSRPPACAGAERRVASLVPQDSHWPERAGTVRPFDPAAAPEAWDPEPARPVLLLDRAEPILAEAEGLPDMPPPAFRWRGRSHRLGLAEGPERLRPEWWRDPAGRSRDYYRVETLDGCRLWLYREVGGANSAPSPPAGEGRCGPRGRDGMRGPQAAPSITPHPAPAGPPSPARGEGNDRSESSPSASRDVQGQGAQWYVHGLFA